VLFLTRNRWKHLILIPNYVHDRLRSNFASDIEDGLTSAEFDLNENLDSGDSRAGLDSVAKREVKRIMRSRKVDFNEARRLYMQQKFAQHGVGPDGRPRDPKFVSFS